MRTCSDVRVDDCKTVNKVHYCYCPKSLCNGENAESIIEKFGDINDDDGELEDLGDEEDDSEGSGSDDEDINYSSTIQTIDSLEQPVHGGANLGNKFPATSVSTAQPTINKAVNFNLSKNLLNCLAFAYFYRFYLHRSENN